MKIWVDDIRPAPEDFVWCKTTDQAKNNIKLCLMAHISIELIDLDHDAGDYNKSYYGGDYINILNWLEENNINIPIRIHSMNPVGVQNMRAIIQRNGWEEIY